MSHSKDFTIVYQTSRLKNELLYAIGCICLLLYHGKENIHSYIIIELFIYQLKCYSPTSMIRLALLFLRPKLVLLLTDLLQSCLCLFFSFCFSVLKRHGVVYTSTILEVTWYELLYNIYHPRNYKCCILVHRI